jgi:hypothetical protein
MAFTDWIKNGSNAASKTAPENTPPKITPVNERHAQEAAKTQEPAKPITPEIKAQAERATAALDKATQHQQAPSAPASPEGSSNAAQLQNQNQQDKTQAALSPTDDAKGKTATQENKPALEKTTERAQQTIARRPPSWER